MRILAAPDSFKGSLTAPEAAAHMAAGIRRAAPGAEVICFPVADGGEGTASALLAATGGRWVAAEVMDPLYRPLLAGYGVLGDGETAVVELASASGLTLLAPGERDPLITSTYGTGQLIRAALEAGFRKLLIGIGGSATHDGGMGLLQALGVRFYDGGGALLPPVRGLPEAVAGADAGPLRELLAGVGVRVACDVDNPLCGPSGAAAVFAAQKGAAPESIPVLDGRLLAFGRLSERVTGRQVLALPGGGAAGGVGAALYAYLGAVLEPGIQLVMNHTGLGHEIAQADLVVTGEGRLDGQTLHGKAPLGVARAAAACGVPVIGIGGSLGPGAEALLENGFHAVYGLAGDDTPVEEAMTRAGELLALRTAAAVAAYLTARKR